MPTWALDGSAGLEKRQMAGAGKETDGAAVLARDDNEWAECSE